MKYHFSIENLEAHWRRIRQSLESHYAGLGCDSIKIEAVRWGSSITQKEKRPVTCSRGNPHQPIQPTHSHYYILHLHASQTAYRTIKMPMQPSIGVPNETEPPNLPSIPTNAGAQNMQDRAGRLAATLELGLDCIALYILTWIFSCTHGVIGHMHCMCRMPCGLVCRPGHACLQDSWGENVSIQGPPPVCVACMKFKKGYIGTE